MTNAKWTLRRRRRRRIVIGLLLFCIARLIYIFVGEPIRVSHARGLPFASERISEEAARALNPGMPLKEALVLTQKRGRMALHFTTSSGADAMLVLYGVTDDVSEKGGYDVFGVYLDGAFDGFVAHERWPKELRQSDGSEPGQLLATKLKLAQGILDRERLGGERVIALAKEYRVEMQSIEHEVDWGLTIVLLAIVIPARIVGLSMDDESYLGALQKSARLREARQLFDFELGASHADLVARLGAPVALRSVGECEFQLFEADWDGGGHWETKPESVIAVVGPGGVEVILCGDYAIRNMVYGTVSENN